MKQFYIFQKANVLLVSAAGTITTFNSIHRICGAIFDAASPTAGTAHATICTFSIPFKVGVHFDANEALFGDPAAAAPTASCIASENCDTGTLGAGNGYSGFYLNYWQNSC